MSLKRELVKRRGLQKKSAKKRVTENELEKMVADILRTEVQRAPKKLSKAKIKKLLELERHRLGRPLTEAQEEAVLERARREMPIETEVGHVPVLQARDIEQLMHRGQREARPLRGSHVRQALLKRLKVGDSKKKPKKSGTRKSKRGGIAPSIDVRYSVPLRMAENIYGSGAPHEAQYQPQMYGSLNPPIDYGPLNYLANLPTYDQRTETYRDRFQGGNVVGGANEHYYQAEDIPLWEKEQLVAQTASHQRPYLWNDVSQEMLLPQTRNPPRRGPQGQQRGGKRRTKRGGGFAEKVYQHAANAYRRVRCGDRSRSLMEGEIHPGCANFCGE